MFSSLSPNIKGIILALIGFTSFAVADATAKYMSAYYEAIHFVGIAGIFTTLFLLVLSPLMGGIRQTFKTEKLKIQIARAIVNPLLSIVIVLCLGHLSIAQVYTMVFTAPFITSLLAIPIFKERVQCHSWIAIALGFVGVLIILRPGFQVVDPWLLAALLLAFIVSASFLLARALGSGETLLSLCLFPALGNLVLAGPVALFVYGWPQVEHLPFFALQSSALIIAITSITAAFNMARASVIAPINYTQMVWAVLFGYLIFGDVPDIWTLTGGIVIIASGIFLLIKERKNAVIARRD